jgi:hypothetical protein
VTETIVSGLHTAFVPLRGPVSAPSVEEYRLAKLGLNLRADEELRMRPLPPSSRPIE